MALSNTPQPTESAEASKSVQLSAAKIAACSHLSSFKAAAVNSINCSQTADAAAKQCVRSVRWR